MSHKRRGFTLIEVMLGVFLLATAGVALLLATQRAMMNAEYLSQFQMAMNAAQGEIESLSSMTVETLLSNQYALAQTPLRGQCAGEDVDCNEVLTVAEDLDGDRVLDGPMDFNNDGIQDGKLIIQIQPADMTNNVDPAIVNVHVAACWGGLAPRPAGFRGHVIPEDSNCNGILDLLPGIEDLNGNGWVDSPVMFSTRVAIRE